MVALELLTAIAIYVDHPAICLACKTMLTAIIYMVLHLKPGPWAVDVACPHWLGGSLHLGTVLHAAAAAAVN
jgi:hypothetical protein